MKVTINVFPELWMLVLAPRIFSIAWEWEQATRYIQTLGAHGTEPVLVECETFVKRMGPHRAVEGVAAGEVEEGTVILVVWDQPDIQSPELLVFPLQLTYTLCIKAHDNT